MKAYYDNKPSKIEAVGNGSYMYRYDIEEVENQSQTEEEKKTQWQCEEVVVWAPLTQNRITQVALSDRWDSDYEQKLINEYNSAELGVYDEETSKKKIDAYTEFLKERAALKDMIDADCEELGIK